MSSHLSCIRRFCSAVISSLSAFLSMRVGSMVTVGSAGSGVAVSSGAGVAVSSGTAVAVSSGAAVAVLSGTSVAMSSGSAVAIGSGVAVGCSPPLRGASSRFSQPMVALPAMPSTPMVLS